jgi:hypothetical protein
MRKKESKRITAAKEKQRKRAVPKTTVLRKNPVDPNAETLEKIRARRINFNQVLADRGLTADEVKYHPDFGKLWIKMHVAVVLAQTEVAARNVLISGLEAILTLLKTKQGEIIQIKRRKAGPVRKKFRLNPKAPRFKPSMKRIDQSKKAASEQSGKSHAITGFSKKNIDHFCAAVAQYYKQAEAAETAKDSLKESLERFEKKNRVNPTLSISSHFPSFVEACGAPLGLEAIFRLEAAWHPQAVVPAMQNEAESDYLPLEFIKSDLSFLFVSEIPLRTSHISYAPYFLNFLANVPGIPFGLNRQDQKITSEIVGPPLSQAVLDELFGPEIVFTRSDERALQQKIKRQIESVLNEKQRQTGQQKKSQAPLVIGSTYTREFAKVLDGPDINLFQLFYSAPVSTKHQRKLVKKQASERPKCRLNPYAKPFFPDAVLPKRLLVPQGQVVK